MDKFIEELLVLNEPVPYTQEILFCSRIIVALLLGGLLGKERTIRNKSAGERIYSLVSAGSCLLMLVSKYGFMDILEGSTTDPSRIAAAVISGVSFICLAVINRQGTAVRGLSTAAGLWCTSAIGLSVGAGFYVISIITTLIVLAIQIIMHRNNIDNDSMTQRDVKMVMTDSEELRQKVITDMEKMGCKISSRGLTHNDNGTMEYSFVLILGSKLNFEDIIDRISTWKEIKSIDML